VLLKFKSAPEVMTSSEATSPEATSPEAEVHQELKNLKLQKLESLFILSKSC